jgi:hypothetical protein
MSLRVQAARNVGRTAAASAAISALIGIMATAAVAAAQAPGVPVLQNAFATPGIAIAANFGGGSGQSFYGAAGGWGMGSGRLQLSGAAGVQHIASATRGAYGARAAMTLWKSASQSLGVAAFAGFGGAQRTRSNNVVTNAAVVILPVGATVGYRRAMGSRGLSVYASPLYVWTRADNGFVISSGGTFAGAAGLDYAFSPSLGATIGAQLGQSTVTTPPGKGTGTIGLAVSFVPGRR